MNISGIGASPIYQRNSFGKTSLINAEGYDSRTHVSKTTTKAENERIKQLEYLTTDQKKELMEKYDIKNMKFGSKAHKDFMNDLVDIGAISQEDYDNSFNTERIAIAESSNPNSKGKYCYFREDGKGGMEEVSIDYEMSDKMELFNHGISDDASMYSMLEVSYDGYMGMYKNVLKDSYEKGILPDDEYLRVAESNKRVFDVIQSIFE